MNKFVSGLVVGAGASSEFRFPLGGRLIHQIYRLLGDPPPAVKNAIFRSGIIDDSVLRFRKSLRRCGKLSIDEFLIRRREFFQIGQIAITYLIGRHERETQMFPPSSFTSAWCGPIFRTLFPTKASMPKDKFLVVTLNYDRSFEYYMVNALRHSYDLPDVEIAKRTACLPIVHLHGSLGNLPLYSATSVEDAGARDVPFGWAARDELISTSSSMIQLIDTTSSGTYSEVRKLLMKCGEIYFIGFGYHDRIIEKLKLNDPDFYRDAISLYGQHIQLRGTCKGWSIPMMIRDKFGRDILLADPDTPIANFLDHRWTANKHLRASATA